MPTIKPMDYFEFFGLPHKLTLDVVALETQFYAMSRRLHPDRFASKSVTEQEAGGVPYMYRLTLRESVALAV